MKLQLENSIEGGQSMTEEAIRNRLNSEVKALKPKQIAKLYSPDFYLNDVLEYVFEHHISSACIHVQLAEMLYSISIKTGDRLAGMLADILMTRTEMIFKNKPQTMYVENTVNFIRQYIETNFAYLTVDISGRIKSLVSFLIKALDNITEYLILEDLDLEKLFSAEEERTIARGLIKEMQADLIQSCTRDTFGIRFIIFSVNRSRDEEVLEQFCFEFSSEMMKILKKRGFRIEKTTDYISFPKGTYKSFQWKAIWKAVESENGISLEGQVRTERMHEEAENGKASHRVYKEETKLYKYYTNKFLAISKKGGNEELHKRMGIIKEQNIRPSLISLVGETDIPDELTGFSNPQVIDDILNKPGVII